MGIRIGFLSSVLASSVLAHHDPGTHGVRRQSRIPTPGLPRMPRLGCSYRRDNRAGHCQSRVVTRPQGAELRDSGCDFACAQVIARATPWMTRSRPSARPRVRFWTFSAKSGTKACSPSGFGGSARTACIVSPAWSVRSFHCSIENPDYSTTSCNRSDGTRWLSSGRSAHGSG